MVFEAIYAASMVCCALPLLDIAQDKPKIGWVVAAEPESCNSSPPNCRMPSAVGRCLLQFNAGITLVLGLNSSYSVRLVSTQPVGRELCGESFCQDVSATRGRKVAIAVRLVFGRRTRCGCFPCSFPCRRREIDCAVRTCICGN